MPPIPSGYRNPRLRFWRGINKNGPIPEHRPELGPCWLWTKGRLGNDYGVFYVNGKTDRAHRYSWLLHFGPVPDNIRVLHKCDNRVCVRPTHLFLGTDADNIHDMMSKYRHPHGSTNGNSVATEEQVRIIRSRYIPWSKKHGAKALARELGLTMSIVIPIANYRTWKHVK